MLLLGVSKASSFTASNSSELDFKSRLFDALMPNLYEFMVQLPGRGAHVPISILRNSKSEFIQQVSLDRMFAVHYLLERRLPLLRQSLPLDDATWSETRKEIFGEPEDDHNQILARCALTEAEFAAKIDELKHNLLNA